MALPKPLKFILWLVLGLAVAIGLFLLWALQKVDYTPYFTTGYYQTTRARLDSVLADARLSHGAVRVGFGRSSLTPAIGAARDSAAAGEFVGVPLAGYSDRQGRMAEGVHDSLFVSAIWVQAGDQNLALVSCDALIFPQEVADAVIARIAPETGLRREQVLFSATHSHSGIGAWGEGWLAEQFAGKYNANVREWFIRQVVLALQRGRRDLTPARFGQGSFAAPAFVRNRLVDTLGRVDSEFTFAVFRQDDGDYAILGTYAAHATVLSAKNMQFSGDWPGYWRRAVERQIPGMAVFFAGGVGSHGPKGTFRGFELAQEIGEALADSVVQHFPRVSLQGEISVAAIGIPVALPEHHIRVSDELRVRPSLARLIVPQDTTYLQAMRLERLLWAGTPCDFSGEIAVDLKNDAARSGFSAQMTSFDAGYVGYIIPSRYYHLNEYESRLMSFFGPYMGDYFEEMIRRMLVGLQRLQAVAARQDLALESRPEPPAVMPEASF